MKAKKYLWLVALLLTVWLICLPPAVQAAPARPIGPIRDTGATITISVVEWTQRYVVSGAAVSTTVDGKTVQMKTDVNGKATFAKLPPGTYSFDVKKAGHLSGTASIAIKGGVREYTFYVCEVASYNYPQYSVSGKIMLREGWNSPYPRAGIKVAVSYAPACFGPEVPSWLSRANIYTAVTDATGSYRINGIAPGIYRFTVSYPGYTGPADILGTNAWHSDYNPPEGLYLGFLNRYSNAYTINANMYKN